MKPTKTAAKKSTPTTTPTKPPLKIALLVKENPKRKGSASHKRFALYRNGMTTDAFLKAGGTRSDLRWDTAHKFIAIS